MRYFIYLALLLFFSMITYSQNNNSDEISDGYVSKSFLNRHLKKREESSLFNKFSYIWNQGWEQFYLINNARKNSDILSDNSIKKSYKDKILKIQKYKKYFYNYLGKSSTKIYDKTVILDRDAITYLVIASPYDKIDAHKECFLIVGCFPYLGFFSYKDAIKYAKSLEEMGKITYIRPVYAYSTLNYLADPIVSSFFRYDDKNLAELIFHELFHTIFFVENEVMLNENLANYFASRMAWEYFYLSDKSIIKIKNKRKLTRYLYKELVIMINNLDKLYKRLKPKDRKQAEYILNKFIKNNLRPHFIKICKKNNIVDCFPLNIKWNNASFVEFKNYQGYIAEIENLHSKLKISLKDFFYYIQSRYIKYKNSNRKGKFKDILIEKL